MIQITKKSNKKPLAIIITAAVLVILTVSLVVMDVLIRGGFLTPEEIPEAPEPIEIIDGEYLHNGKVPYIYPVVDADKIQSFSVECDNGYFAAKRPGKNSGIFVYYYKDETGTERSYIPPISYNEASFDFTSLYAVSNDGINTHKLTYVLAVLGSLQFNERIALKTDDNGQYSEQLAAYGLTVEKRETLSFTYLDENGKEASQTIHIGNRLISGIGYYIQVEGRDGYVYVVSGAENLKYALEGFNEFVNPRLIMQGNPKIDTTAEPLLSPSYKQWKNVVYDGKDEWGNAKPVADRVAAGSTVVFNADVLTSIYKGNADEAVKNTDGYIHSDYRTMQVDLESFGERDIYKRFVNTLIGKGVGSYEDDELLATVVYNNNTVEMKDGEGKYTYTVFEIKAAITEDGERTSGAVGDADLIRVLYSPEVDGESVFNALVPAVIDLNDERIPENVRSYLRNAQIGWLPDFQKFDFTYTADNSNTSRSQYVITAITLIEEIIDDELIMTTKVTENSIVGYNYQIISDGVVLDEGTQTAPLYEITDESDILLRNIKEALVGRSLEVEMDLTVYEQTEYNQFFMNFATYKIKSIDYYVVRELVSAFKFVNPADRDVFYGEAIQQNDLPEGHKYKNYAIDWQSCDYVTKTLGGIALGSSSTVFQGLVGEKVVDVGITPNKMKKYGLYAYTIYFEIPRDLVELADSSYLWLDTIGTTLYISERNSEGKRYVASDMYDIIVEMDADTLYWIEEDFLDFWARRDLVMIQHTKLDKLTANVNLEGFKGKYDFTVRHPDAWIYQGGLTFVEPEEGGQKYNALSVSASVSGDYTSSLLSQCIEKYGVESFELAKVYNLAAGVTSGNYLVDGYDTLGDSAFKYLLSVLYSTGYVGHVSAEDKAAALLRAPVLSLTFEVGESSGYEYGYDFYYTDDGRVAVSLYRYDASTGAHIGESCDFYVSNFSFKKIVYALHDIINGVVIDLDDGFRDEL